MSEIVSTLLESGKILLHFDDTVALVNNTAKTQDVPVPANTRWILQGGFANNGDDVARNLTILWLDGTNTVAYIRGSTALNAGAVAMFPNTLAAATSLQFPANGILLDPGYIVRFTWATGGASTGGTSTISLFGVELGI